MVNGKRGLEHRNDAAYLVSTDDDVPDSDHKFHIGPQFNYRRGIFLETTKFCKISANPNVVTIWPRGRYSVRDTPRIRLERT
jgi:hypothetical protein